MKENDLIRMVAEIEQEYDYDEDILLSKFIKKHGQDYSKGCLEKSLFCPNSALRMKILSSTYELYACGKIYIRALTMNKNFNFSR